MLCEGWRSIWLAFSKVSGVDSLGDCGMKVGWRTEPLNAVCQLINRGVSPAYVESGGVAVLNQKCVRDHAVNFDLGRRHNSAEKKVSVDKFLRAGDVLVNSTGTGTLGRVAQLRNSPIEPTTVDSHVTVVRPKDGLFYPEFFGYALIAIEEQIQEGGEGCGGQTELARSKLANDFRVSFPDDISTQQRIVTLLDEAFDGIATAKANAEKNLQNARAIFESHPQSVFTQGGMGGRTEHLIRCALLNVAAHHAQLKSTSQLLQMESTGSKLATQRKVASTFTRRHKR